MSRSYRREVAKKLKETILKTADPMEIAALANQLAKFLPKPKSPRRRRGTPVAPIKVTAPTIEDMIAAMEKKRRGLPLTEVEQQMVAAMENKRKEARNTNQVEL